MDKRRLLIAGMWIFAIVAIAAIYLNLEPEVEDVQTRSDSDAPTFGPDDRAEGGSRASLSVGEDEGALGRYRGGRRHTGRSPFRGPLRAERAWRYQAGGRITAQPVLADDGTIYIGTHARELHAVDGEGRERWRARLHQRIWSAAAVVDDTVYVGSDAGAFFALDRADGSTRWRVRVRDDADGAPAIGEDGTLYFTAGSHLLAADSDGHVRWRFAAAGPFLLSSPAIDSDGTLYLGSIDDHLYAIANDGRMRWSYESGGDISSSPAIGDDGTIYFGSDDQHIHAVDRDGHRRWRTHLDGYIRAPVALGRNGDIIAGVYGPRPRVVSLDAETGELRWYFPVTLSESSELGVASGPLVDADGNIYFGAHDDYVYGLSPNGELRWIHQTGADVDSAPILTEDGLLLVGCDDGYLYAIREATSPPDAGGADPDAGVADPDATEGGPGPENGHASDVADPEDDAREDAPGDAPEGGAPEDEAGSRPE